MVAMGKAGLLGHSLGGYGLPSPGASGTSAVSSIWQIGGKNNSVKALNVKDEQRW